MFRNLQSTSVARYITKLSKQCRGRRRDPVHGAGHWLLLGCPCTPREVVQRRPQILVQLIDRLGRVLHKHMRIGLSTFCPHCGPSPPFGPKIYAHRRFCGANYAWNEDSAVAKWPISNSPYDKVRRESFEGKAGEKAY